MHTLSMILLACLVGGLISMAAAATVVFRLSQRATAILVAFAAGVMLSSAFLHVLPEAFNSLQSPGMTAAGGGKMAEICDVCLVIPDKTTARAQEIHSLIGHILCEIVEE